MKRRLYLFFGLLVSVAAGGCSPGGSCLLRIELPEDSRELLASLEIWVVTGSQQDCSAMIQGKARPGDPGLEVVAHRLLSYPAGAEVPGLDDVPVGEAAFFVEGRGSNEEIYLRGCQVAEVKSSGTVEVVVSLDWVCKPVPEECGNGIDDDCDGDTDEGCVECEVDEDCDDGNPCTIDFCTDNECHQADFPDDTPCSDANPCTVGDACDSGVCVGENKDCSAFDGPCNKGVCDEQNGECGPLPKEDGTVCNDGQWCTDIDECHAGSCVGSARDCADDDPCTRDTCNEGEQACDHVREIIPGAEGPPGDESCDNDVDDDCDGLTDEEDPNCFVGCTSDQDCDDGNPCTSDKCDGLECSNTPVENGTVCSDGQYCTVSDECNGGNCSGSPRDCGQGAGPCEEGVCLEAEDMCEIRDKADGSPCDDGLYCSVGDQCASGVCQGGDRDCDDDDVCTQDGCDEENNRCTHDLTPIPDAEGLDIDDTCDNDIDDDCDRLTDEADPDCIECTDNGECSDGNPCTADTCQDGICSNEPEEDGTSCDDGQYCSVDDECLSGACVGSDRSCGYLANECHEGICDEENDTCLAEQVVNGTPCEDGLYCTVDDVCQDGTCAGSARDCDDDDPCTVDDCDEPTSNCTNTLQENPGAEGPPGHSSCSDEQDNDCDLAVDLDDPDCYECQSDGDCNDNNQCTDDVCDWGVCLNPALGNGTVCNDGSWCTVDDACQEAVCVGAARDCSSFAGECLDGVCDEDAEQCVSVPKPDGTFCDDGQWCSVEDQCQSGVCQGTERNCDHLDGACHDGVCDEGSQSCVAQQKPDGTACEDGLWCTVDDECSSGFCSGVERDCDDEDVCTIDDCDEENSVCTHVLNPQGNEGPPAGAICTNGVDDDCDGLTDIEDPDCYNCTGNEDCDDGNPCTDDICDLGVCHNDALPDNTNCDDGYWCTVSDRCTAGVCGGNLRGCEDYDDACHDGVCDLDLDECVAQQKPDGTACNDELWCTVGDVCQSGVCTGSARDCTDSEPCTVDGCDEDADACENTWTERPEVLDYCEDGIDQDCDGLADGCCLATGGYTAVSENPIGSDPWYMLTADLNLDGIPDLATVNRGDSTVSVLIGNGTDGRGDGTFEAADTFSTGSTPYGIAAADLDADSLPDLVTANNAGNSVSVHWGQGGGAFGERQDISFAPVTANPVQVVIADFDSNGIPDLATANWGDDSIAILLGDGSEGQGNRDFNGPVFYSVGAAGVVPRALTTADFDSDGILDLAVGNWSGGRVSVLYGGGSGGRGDGTFGSVARFEAGNSEVNIAHGDFNADGILDLAVAAMNDGVVNILLGDGSDGRGDGTFLSRTAYPTGSTPVSVRVVDMQADGILDLVVAEWGTNKVSVLKGNGSNGRGDGTFGARSPHPVGSYPSAAVVLESTGDGIPDVAACNYGPDSVHLLAGNGSGGVGDGSFVIAGTIPAGDYPNGILASDLDADKIVDLLAVGRDDTSAGFFGGQGSNGRGIAEFAAGWSGTTGSSPDGLSTADVDGDRIPDLLVANRADGNAGIFMANGGGAQGDGTFASQVTYAAGVSPTAVVCRDVDSDAICDLVSLDADGDLGVRAGQGIEGVPDGSFDTLATYPAGTQPEAFGLGDVDGDAISDVVVADKSTAQVRVLLGDGSDGIANGGFTAGDLVSVGSQPADLALADLDRDGDLDLIVANSGSDTVSIRPNQGDGSFSSGHDIPVGAQPVALVVDDFDSDKVFDLVTTNQADGTLSVLLGNGDATFALATSIPVGGAPVAVAAGHFDWDGRLDLAVSDVDNDVIVILRGTGSCSAP